MVPLKYNIRSLHARKVGSLMTIIGVGMVVWASVFAFGLSAGLDRTLEIAADPLDVIVLRKGSTSEAVSAVTEAAAREIKALPGIATDGSGNPLAASELVVFAYLPRRGSTQPVNVAVRGVEPLSRQLRAGMKVVEGRDFKPGLREAIVSRAMSQRFQKLGLGDRFKAEGGEFGRHFRSGRRRRRIGSLDGPARARSACQPNRSHVEPAIPRRQPGGQKPAD
jgi:hypothetical protein